MSPITRRRWLQQGTAVASLGIAGLGRVHAALPARIRIGVANPPVGNPPVMSSASSIAPAYVQGWIEEAFAADGTKIEWLFFKGTGPAVNEALTNGQLDFAFQGDLPAVIGRANGLKTRVLMATSSRTHIYALVPAESPVRGIGDLRGRRIAFAKGTMTQLPANRLLEAAGLSERDLRIVSLDTATQQAALISRDIDGLFGAATLLKHQLSGQARVVGSTKTRPAFTGQSVMLVTEPFAQAHPEAVERVVQTLVRSAHWASEPAHRDETYAIWARGGTPEAVWREEFEGTDFAARLGPLHDAFLTARLQQAVADAQRYRLIRRSFEAETWIDRRPVRSALKRLQLEGYWKAYAADGQAMRGAQG